MIEWERCQIFVKDCPPDTNVEIIGYYELFPRTLPSHIEIIIVISLGGIEHCYKKYRRKLFGHNIPEAESIRDHHIDLLNKIINKYRKLSYSALQTKFDLLKSKL